MTVFLDLAKAFDTVDHDLLLNIMSRMGIRGLPLKLFKNYLSERDQVVRVDGAQSSILQMKTGVPQGTILGPVLFLLYTNHFIESKNIKGHITAYADDTAILFKADTWENLFKLAEGELKKIKQYLETSLLSLNISKTKFITFTLTDHDQPSGNSLPIHTSSCNDATMCNCSRINKTTCIKYLGLILDQHLRWKEHVTYIVSRLKKLTYKFYQLRDVLGYKNLRVVYGALAESLIKYCILVWGGVYQEHVKNLNVIQNTLLKILFKRKRLYSTESLYTGLKVMNVKQLYAYSCLVRTFENRNLSDQLHMQTRSSDDLKAPLSFGRQISRDSFFTLVLSSITPYQLKLRV